MESKELVKANPRLKIENTKLIEKLQLLGSPKETIEEHASLKENIELTQENEKLKELVKSLDIKAKEDKLLISRESEEKRNLLISNAKILGKIKDLENEVKNLEEHKKKSINLLAQANEKFERMLTMEKHVEIEEVLVMSCMTPHPILLVCLKVLKLILSKIKEKVKFPS